MYKFYLKNVTKAHRYEELIKLFLSPDDFYIILDEKDVNSSRCLSVQDEIFQRLSTEKIFIRELNLNFHVMQINYVGKFFSPYRQKRG